MPGLGGLLALLSALFAQLFSNGAVYFIALKAVMVTLFITVLPIVLENVFASIVGKMLDLVGGSLGSPESITLSLTGLAGYIADQLELGAAFAVLMSFLAAKVTLRLIPFVRL